VVAGVRCKPVGASTDELRDAARAILRLSEQYAVERALWRGGVWPAGDGGAVFLAQNPTILSATPVSPKAAIGMLEDALVGLSGGVGVIHAPRLALGVLGADGTLRQSGGRMLTLVDTPVALGGGYDGSGPGGGRPAGTGVGVRDGAGAGDPGAGDDLPSDPRLAVNRATNDALVMAVRVVSVGVCLRCRGRAGHAGVSEDSREGMRGERDERTAAGAAVGGDRGSKPAAEAQPAVGEYVEVYVRPEDMQATAQALLDAAGEDVEAVQTVSGGFWVPGTGVADGGGDRRDR
jgi:hypothetical protein